jgi:SpoVK/Ycf46/Vps4 family AAA+-type ATPase
VCRVLAEELVGPVTVVFCDARTVAHQVRELYRQLEDLAPALVVMEDVDLVIAHRGHSGGGEALNDFLLALDGAMSRHSAVVTIATTNDVDGIDPAARRASRFDGVVRVDKPDLAARARILGQLLAGFDPASVDVDVARVAAGTRGSTGADLRELVGLAVLHGEPVLSTELLLRLARPEPDETVGLYL